MEFEGGDDRTFKVNFTAEGVATLKDTIRDKLKEFMGDYTDDTLVDYVIVLLRNGRRKVEAGKELHVFLGDDNLSFISWLWDHLSSNLELYVEPPPAPSPKLQKGPQNEKEKDEGKTIKRQRREWNLPEEKLLDRPAEKEQPKKGTKRQKIVWEEREKRDEGEGEGGRGRFPLRSVVTSVLNSVDKGGERKALRSERRRVREEEVQPTIKQEAPSRVAVDAPRRLLQFAVRDAVKPMRLLTAEPAPVMNRLRSVLSAPASETHEFREEEEDKEDQYSMPPARSGITMPGGSSRVEGSSVFDRLGRAGGEIGISRAESEEDKYSSDSASNKDGYDMVECSAAHVPYPENETADVVRKAVPASQTGSKPSKILNISVNVNTWKPPGMVQETHSFSLQNNEVSKAESTEVTVPAMVQKVLPKTPTPVTSRSLEDPDSRTLFASNVHFAATKDALSRHFNKFGAVLKVIILTDVNTGQPTGSAYVEFLQKQSAEAALSLNGTSFMSRILKVVRKNSHEAGPTAVPGRAPSTVSFPSRAAVRSPYPMRGRAQARGGGARSLQWKRGGHLSDASSPPKAAVRSFTYTRAPPKALGHS